MVTEARYRYNRDFNEQMYQKFLDKIYTRYNHKPPFRIAETPVFIPNQLKDRLIDACNEINQVITRPDFKELTKDAIKHPSLQVPGEDYHTRFLQMDFGVCLDEKGDMIPQLIEVQGFPSLYFFQDLLSKTYRETFGISDHFSEHLDGITL